MGWKTQSEIDLMPSDMRDSYYEKQGLQSDGTRGSSSVEKLDGGMLATFLLIAFVFSICVAVYNMYQTSDLFFGETREQIPLLFYTNPVWLVFVLFISHKHIIPRFFSAVFLTFSLPVYVSLLSIPLFAYLGTESFDIEHHIFSMFSFAFGELHVRMHSFLVFGSNDLSGFNYINGILLIIGFPMLFKIYHGLFAKQEKWHPMNHLKGFFIDIISLSFIYFSSFKLIQFSYTISDLFGLFITWNVLLYSFFGIRLAFYNKEKITCNKVGKIFSYYYSILFIGLYGYIASTNIDLLKVNDPIDAVIYIPLLTVLFVLYSVFNNKCKGCNKCNK